VLGLVGFAVLVLFATGQAASEYDEEISGSESADFWQRIRQRREIMRALSTRATYPS
jgi:hypothetical protein